MFKNNKRLTGAAIMVTSAFFFALVGVVIKLAGNEVGVWQVSFYRAIVGIFLMLILARTAKISLAGPNKKLLILRGLSGTVGFLAMIVAVREISLAEVMVLFYLFPAFSAIMSPWINNERLAPSSWAFLALAFGGTVLIIAPGGDIELKFGHLCGLITALTMGLNTALVRRLSGQHSPYAIYFFYCLTAAVFSFWPLAFSEESIIPSAMGLLYLAGIGLTSTLGQVLMNQGFTHMPAAEGGVLLMSQVVIASSWGVLFFGEPLSWRLVLGGVMIMVGGTFLNRASHKTNDQAPPQGEQ